MTHPILLLGDYCSSEYLHFSTGDGIAPDHYPWRSTDGHHCSELQLRHEAVSGRISWGTLVPVGSSRSIYWPTYSEIKIRKLSDNHQHRGSLRSVVRRRRERTVVTELAEASDGGFRDSDDPALKSPTILRLRSVQSVTICVNCSCKSEYSDQVKTTSSSVQIIFKKIFKN